MTGGEADLLRSIAARYGAVVAPGAALHRIPTGASALPLPVWDGKQLVVPGHREAMRAASSAQYRAARKRNHFNRAARNEQLRAMHAQGLRPPAMAEALGLNVSYIYQLLAAIGIRIERDPAQYIASAARMVAARISSQQAESKARDARIAAMIAGGATLEAVAAELGITDDGWLRRLVRRAVPGYVMPQKRRGPAPKAAPERARAKRGAYLADRNAAILALHGDSQTVEAIAAAHKVTPLVVTRVLRAAGCAPRYDRDHQTARRIADLPRLLAEGLTSLEIAALWGCSVQAVYAMACRAGISLRVTTPAPHNKGRVSPEVAARRATVADMVRAGCADAEILRVVKVHKSTLSEDIQRLGLAGLRRTGGDMRKGRAA